MQKKLLILIIVTLSLFLYPYKDLSVYAQGTYSCFYVPTDGNCYETSNDCIPGCDSTYGGGCSAYNYNPTACPGPHECYCAPVPTSAQGLNQLYPVIQSLSTRAFSFNTSGLGDIVRAVLVFVFPIFGLVLLLFIIYGGYNLMLSGGDPKKAQSARSILTTALIGFVIIFTSYWIVQLVARILGLTDIVNIFS